MFAIFAWFVMTPILVTCALLIGYANAIRDLRASRSDIERGIEVAARNMYEFGEITEDVYRTYVLAAGGDPDSDMQTDTTDPDRSEENALKLKTMKAV